MRVLEIVADGRPGGGTTHVLQILKGLSSFISFELVAQSGSYLLQMAQKLGIPCHGVDFFYSRLNPAIPIQLRRICSHVQPHVAHVHGGRAGFFFSLARIDVPLLYTVHGFHVLHKSLVLRWLALQAERIIFQRASRIVFVSHYDAALARRLGLLEENTPHELIYNGIAFHDIPSMDERALLHIGFVGRLEPQKDPMLFLDVLEHLPGYSATIVGAGSLDALVRKEICRRGLTKRVRMLGGISQSDTLKILPMFSVVVLSSRWEGLPLIVLEAMGMGIPVVSMNVSGMSEIIENGMDGILIDQRSGASLANGVKKVLDDSSLRSFIIQNARSKIQKKFSEDQMLQSLRRVYQEMK